MTMILAALALAAAQTAPAAPAHQGHQGHHGHEQKAGQHDCKECCKKMAGKDGKMECMMKDGDKKPADGKGKDAHAGHSGH